MSDEDRQDEKPQPVEVGRIPALCKETVIDGEQYIAVPKGKYSIIVLVARAGRYVSVPQAGVSRVGEFSAGKEDWSLNSDVFVNDVVVGPFKHIEVVLDRDTGDRLPVVKLEWVG